jgi:hypothetical protein
MNNYTSSSEKKLLESPEKFTSIKLVFLIYSPCFIALVFAMLCAIIDSRASSYAIVITSLLSLVCGSIDILRKKIIQQDKTIQLLQEKLDEISGASD